MKLNFVNKTNTEVKTFKVPDGHLVVSDFSIKLLDEKLKEKKGVTTFISPDEAYLTADSHYLILIDKILGAKVYRLPEIEEVSSYAADEKFYGFLNLYYLFDNDKLAVVHKDLTVASSAKGDKKAAVEIYTLPYLIKESEYEIDDAMTVFSSSTSPYLFGAKGDKVNVIKDGVATELELKTNKSLVTYQDNKFYFAKENGLIMTDSDFKVINQIEVKNNTLTPNEMNLLRHLGQSLMTITSLSDLKNLDNPSINRYRLLDFAVSEDSAFLLLVSSIDTSRRLVCLALNEDDECEKQILDLNFSNPVTSVKVEGDILTISNNEYNYHFTIED